MAFYEYFRTSGFESKALSGDDLAAASAELEVTLERENAAILQYCDTQGWSDVQTCSDAAMPWNKEFLQRPKAIELLERLQGSDVVIAYTLARVFSSSQDAAATIMLFRERGIGLHIVQLGGDITATDFTVDLLSAATLFGEIERRRSVERIKKVKTDQRRKGRYLGGSRPFGYMIHSNGRLIENPMEQKILKRILQLRDQGQSLRAIAEEVSTPLTPVSFKTVQRILQRNV